MKALSTIYSMFSPIQLAKLIEEYYELSNVSCQLIKATVRDTYHVWAGDERQYIFYIYRHQPRNKQEIEAELAWVEHLHHMDFPTAKPCRTTQGNHLVPLHAPEGLRQAALFEYIHGQTLSKAPIADTIEKCGQLLAQLHTIQPTSAIDRPVMGLSYFIKESLLSFKKAAPNRQADIQDLARVARKLEQELPNLPSNPTLIHGDIIPSNVIIDSRGMPQLIDFDACGYSWHLYDVATFMIEADYWKMDEEIKQAFLRGYETQSSLNEIDHQHLVLLQAVRLIWSLGIAASYVDTWGRIYFSDAIITKQMHMLRQLNL
jgi:Ser/Thr protein kinase RdoA (MazF antagonist)